MLALTPGGLHGIDEAVSDTGTAFVVTYIEVAPSTAEETRGLLRQLREASRTSAGSLGFQTLQRRERPNHFAIVEAWRDVRARERYAGAAATRQFRASLQRLLTAGYDERAHIALAVAPSPRPAAGPGAIHVVTHVDIIPTFKDKGVDLVKELVAASRQEAGSPYDERLYRSID